MKQQYKEGKEARTSFEDAMKKLFKAPKEPRKKQAKKPARHRKKSDRK